MCYFLFYLLVFHIYILITKSFGFAHALPTNGGNAIACLLHSTILKKGCISLALQ